MAPTLAPRPVLGWLQGPRGEERWALDAGSSGLCRRFKGAKTVWSGEEKAECTQDLCASAFSVPAQENMGVSGAGNIVWAGITTDLRRSLWSSVTKNSVKLDCSSPLQMHRMELEIFWGLVRLVEGVMWIALENCLSVCLSFPRFSSSSNYRGSTFFC